MEEISEAKKTVLSYYTSLQTAQVTRFIGFVAGLFTLLQLTQIPDNLSLDRFFSTLFPTAVLPEIWIEIFKFKALFFGTLLITFFILRAIFRFCIFGFLGSYVTNVEKTDIEKIYEADKEEKAKERPLLVIQKATSQKFINDDRRAYGIFKANWFFTFENKSSDKLGTAIQLFLAFVITLSLFMILW